MWSHLTLWHSTFQFLHPSPAAAVGLSASVSLLMGHHSMRCYTTYFAHRSVCFLAKKQRREVGAPPKAPNPETTLRQQIKAATEEPVKEALDAALKKVQEAKFRSLSLRDQKNRLLSQAKSLAEKIDKQTEVITEAEPVEQNPADLEPITGDSLLAILKGVPKDKALGPDGWSFGDLLALGPSGLDKLGETYRVVESICRWPAALSQLFTLQLPKVRAKDAGQRRPLLPVIYRLWAARRKHIKKDWREARRQVGETPVGNGALDEAFGLADWLKEPPPREGRLLLSFLIVANVMRESPLPQRTRAGRCPPSDIGQPPEPYHQRISGS